VLCIKCDGFLQILPAAARRQQHIGGGGGDRRRNWNVQPLLPSPNTSSQHYVIDSIILLTLKFLIMEQFSRFYSARNARIASAVLAAAIPSVRLSVRLSVRHTPVLCQNDGT